MKKLIILIIALLPLCSSAQITSIEQLGKEAEKHKGVEYFNAGSFMLGMASTFAEKSQRKTFEMLDNIDMITCTNDSYTPTLERRILTIIDKVGAQFLASSEDNNSRYDVYAIKRGTTIKHLIILTRGKDGELAITAMSGTIPESRLEEISRLSPPKK